MYACTKCNKVLIDGEACTCSASRRLAASRTLATTGPSQCPHCMFEVPAGAYICGHCRRNVSQLAFVGSTLMRVGLALMLIPLPLALIALLGFMLMR